MMIDALGTRLRTRACEKSFILGVTARQPLTLRSIDLGNPFIPASIWSGGKAQTVIIWARSIRQASGGFPPRGSILDRAGERAEDWTWQEQPCRLFDRQGRDGSGRPGSLGPFLMLFETG